jgi:hypothetical protein
VTDAENTEADSNENIEKKVDANITEPQTIEPTQ